jgi:hypothetical protein
MSQYGYNSSNASTFNQLVRTGVTEEEAAAQSGVSTNASQYGFGTNSNAGAVIPGAGGATNAAGLTTVSYAQSGTGEPGQQPAQTSVPAAGTSTFQDPAQRAAAAATAPVQAAEPAPSPITETPTDSRIISSTPSAASGFGYGTGINNPSVAPTIAADTVNANTSGIPIRNEEGAVVEGIRTNPETGETYYTTVTDQQRVAAEQAATIDANTSGIPIRNEEGNVVEGIRTNPETGETYYTTADTAEPQVKSFAAADVSEDQSAAETARLARLNQAATPPANAGVTPASQTEAEKGLTQRQAAIAAQKRLINDNGDWRVRISLADSATYLYADPSPGILAPLNATNGVIFPYTPKIDVGYKATYSNSDLTHSNYTNYFYQSSSVGQVRISGSFTAQDTVEAQYLLAVIHFFRSATKMFYGQDAERGAPPPLLFVTGLGEYQFNNHPCVLTNFEYSLPSDVDYIRANSPNQNGTDLLKRRTSTQNNLPTNPISGALARLRQLKTGQGVDKGAIENAPAAPTFGKNSPTYVPTKIEISVSLLPIITRNQASRQFSLKQFANGALVKQGFW